MMRNLVRFAVAGLLVNATVQFVPVYVHNHQFTDAVAEAALFSKERPIDEIAEQVMELAARYDIPLDVEVVQVTKDRQKTYINLVYEQQIAWIPGYRRPMPFDIAVAGWHVHPPTGVDPLR